MGPKRKVNASDPTCHEIADAVGLWLCAVEAASNFEFWLRGLEPCEVVMKDLIFCG